MRAHRRIAIVFATLLIGAGLVAPGAAAAATYPSSMASTGDSITRAFNTSWFPFIDNPAASWSTGTSTSVNSQYLRLRSLNPGIGGHNLNDARSGAKMVDLAGQMRTAVSQRVEYVTVLMGGNDLCTSTVGGMTSVATFQAQFASALQTVTNGLPNARIFVASVPNAYRLWELFKNNSSARLTWSLFGVCQSLLANPLSTSAADVARRQQVYQRNVDFNTVLAQTCALYLQCGFDNNAVFNTAFSTADVSSRDYFHPSVSGQARLASVTWAASFWGG
jgi:lysophospholipase L1-like esterase